MDGEELVLQQAGLRLDIEKYLISESIPENHIYDPKTLLFSRTRLPCELLLHNASDSLPPPPSLLILLTVLSHLLHLRFHPSSSL